MLTFVFRDGCWLLHDFGCLSSGLYFFFFFFTLTRVRLYKKIKMITSSSEFVQTLMSKNSSLCKSSKSTGMHAAFGTSASDFNVVDVVHFEEFSIL